jgi:hypothetical protein
MGGTRMSDNLLRRQYDDLSADVGRLSNENARLTALLAERDAKIARLEGALAGTESALFEIRDYCAELQDGDTLERLAYRVVGMANGAINDYYAALAVWEAER